MLNFFTATFRLAAYGVKQGGIGSVLAGGFPMLKKTGRKPETSGSEQANTVRAIVSMLAY
jgi:hypothetical protein